MRPENGLMFFIIACVMFVTYFIPAGIASARKHRNRLAIFVLNLLLGWSGICWLVAIVWACTSDTEDDR